MRPGQRGANPTEVAEKYGIAADVIGETIPERLEIMLDGKMVVSAAVSELSAGLRGRAGSGVAN